MNNEEDLTYEQNYILTTAGSAGVTWALKEKPKKKQKKILCIYSGGMDSTVLLYDLINKGNQVEAIWFNYGQRHKKEHLFAEQICSKLGIEFTELDISEINSFLTNSSLSGEQDIPDVHYEDDKAINTIVPNRNISYGGPSKSIRYGDRSGENEAPSYHLTPRVSWDYSDTNANPTYLDGGKKSHFDDSFPDFLSFCIAIFFFYI